MKKILTIGLAAGFALCAWAQQYTVPTFVTYTATGTTTATVYFASSPLMQARIVGAIATSDLAASRISIRTGDTPLSVAYTNPATAKWIGVSATNGFTIGDYIVLETAAGLVTNAQITGFGAATNIILADQVYANKPGDQIYHMGAATTLPVGAATANYQGEAIFVGAKGRPVWVNLNGTSACTLNAVTGRYE